MIKFAAIPKKHINQLKALDKLIAYIGIDGGVFYRKEHGELFEIAFKNQSNLSCNLSMLKKLGYVENIPGNVGIWFFTKKGRAHYNQLINEESVDPLSVHLVQDIVLHTEAQRIVDNYLLKNKIMPVVRVIAEKEETSFIPNCKPLLEVCKQIYTEIRDAKAKRFIKPNDIPYLDRIEDILLKALLEFDPYIKFD